MRQIVVTLVTLLAPATSALGQGALENGGFEAASFGPWRTIYPPAIQDPAPDFELVEDGAHGGERCARLTTHRPGGFSSFTQDLADPPRGAGLVRLTGWARVESMGESSWAALQLIFHDPSREDSTLGMHYSKKLTGTGDWTRLEIEALVPGAATHWMARCGVLGQGSVLFDDVELVASEVEGELVPAALAVHHATYVVRADHAAREPWIAFSVPFPFERQTPLALRVTSDPPDAILELAVLEDRENRPLKVVLKPLERGAQVRLRAETLVLVADRPVSDGTDVALLDKPRRAPKDVRQHLADAPGVDVDAGPVREAAEGFERTDLRSILRDLTTYLEDELEYDGGSGQGAAECLDSGKAVCTGYANVAASLLIAAEVPTRILACTQRSSRLQEHYIVEAWTPELGWSRIESTMARFPWRDSENLILRVVYPDAKRSPADVPLWFELGGGARGGFDMDPKDTCWQGAEDLGSRFLAEADLERLEKDARKAFEALVRKSATGAAARFAPTSEKAKKLDERTLRVLAEVDAWTSASSPTSR